MSVTIPLDLYKEFILLIEHQIRNLRDDANAVKALEEIRVKAKEFSEKEIQAAQSLSDGSPRSHEQASTSAATITAAEAQNEIEDIQPTVNRRHRRVKRKLTKVRTFV